MTFDEYYRDVYLPLHLNETNRRLHLTGVTVTALYIATCVMFAFWIGLIFSPFVVYPFAWTGHAIEGNKPAAWSNPIWAKAADLRMCYEMVMGRL